MLGFEWFVISYGTHPCCYIKIPEDHELFEVDYRDYYDNDIHINCHGVLLILPTVYLMVLMMVGILVGIILILEIIMP